MKNSNNKISLQNQTNWILQEKYQGKLNRAARRDIGRLRAGEPVDYIIGFVEFLGCKIDLSKKPLIPRPETEYLVQKAIKEMCHNSHGRDNQSTNVLDMFSGSGCIGVSIMRHIKGATVVFAEKNTNFIKQIKINLEINKNLISNQPSGVPAGPARRLEMRLQSKMDKKRYKIIQTDIFSNIKGKYDYIFANPPYIPTARKNKIQKSVLGYEPRQALFGGMDGLFYIRKFLTQAKNFLNENGRIYMEFDPIQKNKIDKLMKGYGYKSFNFYKDQYIKWRYLSAQK